MKSRYLSSKLTEFRNGNLDAYFDIYQELKTPIYTIIYRILYDHSLSEDVMQDVFLRLLKSPPSSNIKNPRVWIFQVARNLAIDHKRKIDRSELISNKTEAHENTFEEDVSTRMDLDLALRQLSNEDREIVTLHLNGNLKFREIAAITNRPLGTVLWKYQKSITNLRQILNGGE